jgi:putative hydrolase
MLRQMGGLLFGAQVGTALSALAGEVVGASDIGLPLGSPALLPQNVAVLAEGLEVPAEEVLLFVALREMAHQRLYAHVPWLRSHVLGAIEEYARGIKVDPEALGRAVEQLDLSQFDPTSMDPSTFDPERLSEVLGADAFTSPQTPEQQAALTRLETALALVEGWVDDVTMQAVSNRLPSAVALQEAIRRRRASGGPAEQTFAALVGLELRPRQARSAATLWKLLREARGIEGREAVWAHPDLLPDADALADPNAYVWRADDALDPLAEIAKLTGEAPKEDAAGTRFTKRDGSDETPPTNDGGDDSPPQPA